MLFLMKVFFLAKQTKMQVQVPATLQILISQMELNAYQNMHPSIQFQKDYQNNDQEPKADQEEDGVNQDDDLNNEKEQYNQIQQDELRDYQLTKD